jgi:hypothetical protein
MEDKLFYYPIDTSENIWKNLQNNYDTTLDSEFLLKKDISGGTGSSEFISSGLTGSIELPKNTHKIYVTLIGGGGSGSLGEKRPRFSEIEDAIYRRKNGKNPDGSAFKNYITDSLTDAQAYDEFVNVYPLPGCGGGGGATLFRIPIVLIQTQKTILKYKVGKGGDGITQGENDEIPKENRIGKNGEDTTLVIEQKDNSNNLIKTFKVKAMGGGGAGVVGYTYSREDIFNMDPTKLNYIFDWSFGPEFKIDWSWPTDITTGFELQQNSFQSAIFGRRRRYYVRQSGDPKSDEYYQYEAIKRLAEATTSLFRVPSYSLIAFHRELFYPIGKNIPIDAAENRNEYIPYNLLTHGEDGILRNEYFKPDDKIKLKGYNEPIYFGGKFNNILPNNPNYSSSVSSNGVKVFDAGLNHQAVLSGDVKYFNFLHQYAPDNFYKDDRAWVQIWDYNVTRLYNHPRYYLRIGDAIMCKDGTNIYPNDSYIPYSSPNMREMTVFESGTKDYTIQKWSTEFQALYDEYGGPLREIPQKKGSTGAFGGAGGGFILYDDPTPPTMHGLKGGISIINPWKLPESGRGGRPYPKQIWDIIDINELDASGLGGAFYYWGGKGYNSDDAISNGGDSKMTLHFIPGSGGGSLDYLHQNNILSRRKYTGNQVDFADILPQISESTMTNNDSRVYEWFCKHYQKLATGGKIKYQLRDISNNQFISRLYMNDLMGFHNIQFTNKGETGPRDIKELLRIFGSGGGGGKAFMYQPGDGQENPDQEPNDPEYGCGSGGSCSLNLDGKAVINGVPRGSVDYYLRKMISYDQKDLYIEFHNEAYAIIISTYFLVITAIILLEVAIAIATQNILPMISSSAKTIRGGLEGAEGFVKLTKESLTRTQKLVLIIDEIISLPSKVFTQIKAFFKSIKDGTKFSDALKAIEEAAAQAQKAAVAAAEASSKELAKVMAGGFWKKLQWRLEQIVKKIPSLLGGEFYEFTTGFTDKIVYNTSSGLFEVKNAFELAFTSTKIIKDAKLVASIGRLTGLSSQFRKLSNIAEGAVDGARAIENIGGSLREGIESFAKVSNDAMETIGKKAQGIKFFQQIDSTDNFIPENLRRLYDEKANDIGTSIVSKLNKSDLNAKDFEIDLNKILDDTYTVKDRREILSRLRNQLDDFEKQGIKLSGINQQIGGKTYRQILNDSIDSQIKGFDDIIKKGRNMNDSVKIDDVILTMRTDGGVRMDDVNVEMLDDTLSQLDMTQREAIIKHLDDLIGKVEPEKVLDLEKFKSTLRSNQKVQFKLTSLADNKKNIEFYFKSVNKFNPEQRFALNQEIFKILGGDPPLSKAIDIDPVSKLKKSFGELTKSPDAITWAYKNSDDFVSLLKSSDFDLANVQLVGKQVDPDRLFTFVIPQLQNNKQFLNLLLTDPGTTLSKLDNVLGISDNAIVMTGVKMELFDSALKNFDDLPIRNVAKKNDLVPNLLGEFRPRELENLIGHLKLRGGNEAVSDLIKQPFVQELNRYFRNNLETLSDGVNFKFVVKDSAGRQIGDYTKFVDELNPEINQRLLKSLEAPNPAKEASIVDNGQFAFELKGKSLSNENTVKLKSLLDYTTESKIDIPDHLRKSLEDLNGNLLDANSFNQFRNSLFDLTENYQKTYLKSVDLLKDATGAVDPNSLAMLNRIYDQIFQQFKDINNELEQILNIPAINRVNIKLPSVTTTEDLRQITLNAGIKLEGSEALEKSLLKNAENKADIQKQIADVKDVLRKNQEKALEINTKYQADLTKYEQETLPEWQKSELEKNLNDSERVKSLQKQIEDLKNGRIKNDELLMKNKRLIESIENDPIFGEYKVKIEHQNGYINENQIFESSPFKKDSKTLKQYKEAKYPKIYLQFKPKSGDNELKTLLIEQNVFNKKWIGKDGVRKTNASTRLALQSKVLDINWNILPDKKYLDDISILEDELKRIRGQISLPPLPPTKPNFNTLDSINIQIQKIERKLNIQNWEVQNLTKFDLPSAPKDPPPVIKQQVHILDTQIISVKTIELPKDYTQNVKPIILNPTNDFEYLFTVIADPIETSTKAPLQKATTLARRVKPDVIPKDTFIPAERFKEWMDPYVPRLNQPLDISNPLKIPFLGAKLTYRVAKALNDYFKTNTFSSMKPIRYVDICDNVIGIDSEIMLRENNNAQNFIDAVVEEIMFSKPDPEDELRLRAYEDIFMDIFQFPVIFTKSQLDNRMLEMLMEQRRRGVVVDLVYARKYIKYENLNIFNQLNYQYLFSEFKMIENLLVHQISIIQKNHMILV